MLIVTAPEAVPRRCGGQVGGDGTGNAKRLCRTSDLKSAGGTWSRSTSWVMTAGPVGSAIGLSESPVSMRETVMSQQSVRQAARRAALDAQAVRRRDRADRERRLEVLAVEVLTAIGERDGAVWDAERRAGEALRTMTGDEGLSVRAAADWCGNAITSREVARLRRLAPDTPSGAG
jgi:hypothetical protein